MKLGAARVRGIGGVGGKRPRQRRDVLVLPDGAGSSSKVRRCNVSEPVSDAPQLRSRAQTWWIRAGAQRTRIASKVDVASTPKPSSSVGGEAMVKVYGVAMAMMPG